MMTAMTPARPPEWKEMAMRRGRRVIASLAAVVAMILVTPALAGAAETTNNKATGTSGMTLPVTAQTAVQPAGSGISGAQSPRAVAAAVSYWTPERMRAAKNKDMPAVTSAQASQIAPAPTGAPGGIVPASGEANTWPSSYNQRPTRVDGKVFFTDNWGQNWVCSASVVNSESHRVVWTAGHCVFDIDYSCSDRAGWYHNWVFVPGYKNGARPYGTWTALEQWTLNGYCNGYWPSAIPYDTGAVVLNTAQRTPDSGRDRRVRPAVQRRQPAGGVGLRLPGGRPLQRPGTALLLRGTFVDTRTTYNQGGHRPHGLACRLNGGSSGGPWVIGTPQTTGNGYINGENSYSYSGDTTHIYSPYYGTAQGNLSTRCAIGIGDLPLTGSRWGAAAAPPDPPHNCPCTPLAMLSGRGPRPSPGPAAPCACATIGTAHSRLADRSGRLLARGAR